jgi:hypothetical protein
MSVTRQQASNDGSKDRIDSSAGATNRSSLSNVSYALGFGTFIIADIMDASAVLQYINESLEGLDVVEANGDHFFFYDPGRDLPKVHRFPFATLVTSDRYDQFSNLNREGVYRLNVGVGKETFRSLFPDASTTHDFTALDRLMPHPVYGNMYWLCVLSPSDATFDRIKPLLVEAHQVSARRHPTSRRASGGPDVT